MFNDLSTIGMKVAFNPVKHDSLDGFIKQKHDCIVILPSSFKSNVNLQENCIIKSQVLPCDYEFP